MCVYFKSEYITNKEKSDGGKFNFQVVAIKLENKNHIKIQ